jgi:hypothetical protein
MRETYAMYFAQERRVTRLLRAAGIARSRIRALTVTLMTRRPAGAPGLLPPAIAARALAAHATTRIPSEVRAQVSPVGQRISADDLARMKESLK